MNCDICQERPGEFIVGNMATGDQTVFCLADFARAGLEIAKAQLPQGEIFDALGIVTASEAETAAVVEAKAKGRKRAPKPKPEPEPGPETPEGLEEASPAVADGGNPGL